MSETSDYAYLQISCFISLATNVTGSMLKINLLQGLEFSILNQYFKLLKQPEIQIENKKFQSLGQLQDTHTQFCNNFGQLGVPEMYIVPDLKQNIPAPADHVGDPATEQRNGINQIFFFG